MAGEGAVILAMDFSAASPWGEERAVALRSLALSIAADTPGLLWKTWTEDEAEGRAGGLYAFRSRAAAEAYRDLHAARVAARGGTDIRARIWGVNAGLSAVTRGPL